MTVDFTTRRGRLRRIALVFISVLGSAGVLFSGMPVWARVVVIALIALTFVRLAANPPAHVVRLDPGGGVSLDGARGTLAGEAVTGLFAALRLTTPDRRTKRAFIFFDELEPDAFRALLAYLRHG